MIPIIKKSTCYKIVCLLSIYDYEAGKLYHGYDKKEDKLFDDITTNEENIITDEDGWVFYSNQFRFGKQIIHRNEIPKSYFSTLAEYRNNRIDEIIND